MYERDQKLFAYLQEKKGYKFYEYSANFKSRGKSESMQ